METIELAKVSAALGVPGFAIGIVYLMVRLWNFRLPVVPRGWAGPIVVLIILVLGGLSYTAIDLAFAAPGNKAPVAEKQIRFDTMYEGARFYPVSQDRVRGDFTIRFAPTTNNNSEAATIFVGMATFHDDERVDRAAWAKHDRRCEESASCIHSPLVWYWDRPGNELIIRGATPGTRHTFSATFPKDVKRVLLYWEFYQREGDGGARCEVDGTRPVPLDGLPYVRSVRNKRPVHDWCYRAWEEQVVPVNISL